MNGLYNFLENNSLFIVLFIVIVVWTGIFLFLLGIDKRLKKIEMELGREGLLESEEFSS